jgi:hypothetical protein
MKNCALRFTALLYACVSLTKACAWSDTRPTLVLQLSRVERARRTPEEIHHARELVLSASFSIALDAAELESPARLPLIAAAEFNLPDARDPPNCGSALGSCDVAPTDAPDRSTPKPAAADSCERAPTLCVWARAQEEAALLALLESQGAGL